MRVLIVEDERFLAEALQAGLRREAIAADVALDGDEALRRIALTDYDVVVLDRDLPGTARRRGLRDRSPASTRTCGS